jgi:hypothetical protein
MSRFVLVCGRWLAWRLGALALLPLMALARLGHGLVRFVSDLVDEAEIAFLLGVARQRVLAQQALRSGRCPAEGVCMKREDCADVHCPGRGK